MSEEYLCAKCKEPKTTSRSASQNRLYWMWLKVIEDETGMPKLDYLEDDKWHKGIHTRFKCDFIDKEFYADGSMKMQLTLSALIWRCRLWPSCYLGQMTSTGMLWGLSSGN